MPTRSAELSGWLPYWFDNVVKPRRKLGTYDKYEARVRLYLVPMVGGKRLGSLGDADVRRFLVQLKNKTTAATAKESHRVLRTALTAASSTSAGRPSGGAVFLYDDDPKAPTGCSAPGHVIAPLRRHRMRQVAAKAGAGESWQEAGMSSLLERRPGGE